MRSAPARPFPRPVRLVALACIVLAGLAAAAWAQQTQQFPNPTAPYDFLTNNRVQETNFNPEPFTGLAFDPLGRLWAVNPYGDTVVRYDGLNAPDLIVPTGLDPVSVATWTDGFGALKVLVACNGTHGLFMHDPETGEVLDFVRLDSEPADLVVDHDEDRAYVSCQGDRTVVEVDLDLFKVTNRFLVTGGSRPGALLIEHGDDGPGGEDTIVYVAPALTGNNSVPIQTIHDPDPSPPLGKLFVAAGKIRDLDLNDPLTGQLPDEDVFRIDPQAGTIVPVVRRVGSLIFDLGRSPASGDLWVLSTKSINKDEDLDTEPKLRGIFAVNQLVQVPGVDGTSGLADAFLTGTEIDLDDIGGGVHAADRSLNQARTLEFLTVPEVFKGRALVASAQSDVIALLRIDGQSRVRDFQLPPHAQCYDLAISPTNPNLFASLCLGTMTIEVFDWALAQSGPVASLPLGFDPTPDQIRSGRDLFLDGQRSAEGRFSCATCHPRGGTDLLAWPLRGDPTDEKDIMFTQSLLSIADTFPHHWRGERDLDDFRKAFFGLLGDPSDPPLTDPSQDAVARDLVVYMQSLQAPANPIQNARRVLDTTRGTLVMPAPAAPGLASSPITGQQQFQNIVNFNSKTCAECHSPQTGSDSSHMTEGFRMRAPRSMPIEMAHLRQLLVRSPDVVTIDLADQSTDPVRDFNRNGFGGLHDGREPSIFRFIFDNFVNFNIPDAEDRANIFRFVEQFDQGISPAVHWGSWYTAGSNALQAQDIKQILVGGATKGWNDVVAIGRFDPGTGFVPARWWYDPSLAKFVSDTPGLPQLSWSAMKTATQQGLAEHAFFGLPPENGRRFAFDFDRDGLLNAEEVAAGTDPWDPDSDDDGWPDGYEVEHDDEPLVFQTSSKDDVAPGPPASQLDFATSRLAKYHVVFDEDVKYTVTYSTSGGPQRVFQRDYFSSADTFVLTHEEPSTQKQIGMPIQADIENFFDVSIELEDRNGNPSGPFALDVFKSDFTHFFDFPTGANLHVESVNMMNFARTADALSADVRVRVDYNYGAPAFDAAFAADDRMVFCTLSIRRAGTHDFVKSTTFTTSRPTTFSLPNPNAPPATLPYEVDPGPPWICSPHTVGEETVFHFTQGGLAPGDEIKISVMGVVTPVQAGVEGVYTEASLQEMQPLFLEDSMEASVVF